MQMSSLTLTVQIKLTLVAWIRENMYLSASLQNHSVTNKYINLFGMPYVYWLPVRNKIWIQATPKFS